MQEKKEKELGTNSPFLSLSLCRPAQVGDKER